MKKSLRHFEIDPLATGKKIQELMLKSNLSVNEFCDIVGIDPRTLYRWFEGDSRPDTESVVMMIKAFGISVDDIIVIVYYK